MAAAQSLKQVTTPVAYSSISSVQICSKDAAWLPGFSVTGMSQNANGTWTFDVSSSLPAGGSGSGFYVDCKGVIADSTDID